MVCRRLLCALLVLGGVGYAQLTHAEEKKPKSKYEQLTEGKKKLDGMWTIHHTDQQLLVELSPAALKKEYIMIPSISRGISRGMVLGGMSWGFGDDVIWAFKKTDDRLFVMQRNVRFRAKANTPEASAVQLAYSDSVLHALPIQDKTPSGGILVDMTSVFMSDDLQIGNAIGPGFRFMQDRSTWSKIKAFEENVELQVNAVYSGSTPIDTVPNSKGVQVGVHYSVSVLPPVGSNGYKPRRADDRIGYFLTAIKDFSEKDDPENFVRYINRWNLQKLDPSIEYPDLSPPKEPIRFYIENTVPVHLRPTVEAAILEWNKAFEKLGFSGAIKVDQQPDDPDFDPENIRYNTFRWMTAEAGFAMGPSRVDPRTGQILDADIIFDASFLNSWDRRWETFRPEDVARLAPNWSPHTAEELENLPHGHRHSSICTLSEEMQRQSGYAAAAMLATGISIDGSLPKQFIHQGLKEVIMHEVGHTLGLRHNFKGSSWKTLEEICACKDGTEPLSASVMDYSPANLILDKEEQGLYYSQTIGPYDYWAIEYGYKPFGSSESEDLKKIAARSGETGLAYSTDEDTRSIDPDPLSNRFDLGSDPLEYVKRQMTTTSELMPKVVEKSVKEGEGYQRARQAFGLLMGEYWRAAGFASRFPGGVYMHRHHKGDEDAEPPFRVVEAEKQREAMKLLAESAFAPPTIDGEQLNYLAASRWSHWGSRDLSRLDYPIHETVLQMQDMILGQVLRTVTLERILDSEFKVAEDEDAYTLAEHMQFIVGSIFDEWGGKPDGEYTNRKPLIPSFRRNLQRSALKRLGSIVSHGGDSSSGLRLGSFFSTGGGVPSDARTLTRMHLQTLKKNAESLLKNKKVTLDDYSRAHLEESVAQIDRVLNASLSLQSVN